LRLPVKRDPLRATPPPKDYSKDLFQGKTKSVSVVRDLEGCLVSFYMSM
jgi:hypothetical protein